MILVYGEALVDIINHEGRPSIEIIGGGPFNTSIAAARMGADVAFSCPISSDERGRRIAGVLVHEGVKHLVRTATMAPTALAHVHVDAQGRAEYTFDLAGSALEQMTSGDAATALSCAPTAVHIGTLALAIPQMAASATQIAAQMDPAALLMVDPNCRPVFLDGNDTFQSAWASMLDRVDVIKISDDDLTYLHGVNIEAAIQALRSRTSALILLTRGANGVDVYIKDKHLHVPSLPVQVVDTVGAGDTFSGAFLARLAESGVGREGLRDVLTVIDAVTYGAAAAALACAQAGAVPPMKAQVEDLLQQSQQGRK